MCKYSKGPWVYDQGVVRDQNGTIVARADRDANCPIKPAVRDQNMRLCAAAPDLYRAAKLIVALHTSELSTLGGFAELVQAIAKADGAKNNA